MSHRERIFSVLDSLTKAGVGTGEVFVKTGRSRRFGIGPTGRLRASSEENGWAVRASTARASFFTAGTGLPDPDTSWPDPDGQPLQLPAPEPVPPWKPPEDLGQALISETEALALLGAVEKALVTELPGGRLIRAVLEEGTSESWIANSMGVDVEFRSRAASLMVEAAGPWRGTSSVSMSFATRLPRGLQPRAIAMRLANRLLVGHGETGSCRERGEVLVASPVAARILYSLMPLWLGPEGGDLAERLRDKQGRIGSTLLNVVDNGRLAGGVLDSPVDGEGRSTGPLGLVEEGRYRRSIRDWRVVDPGRKPWPGCIRRNSWRDLPEAGPSHLFFQSSSTAPVGELLGSISRGYYLVEPLGAGDFDLGADRFRLPVCGFVLRQGRAVAPVPEIWLEGGIGSLLRGIQAVARDLTFHPFAAMIGAPTLLVSGIGVSSANA